MADTHDKSDLRVHAYEAFVLFPQSAGSDLGGCVDHLREILTRAHASILAISKWDERRLAYDIAGNKRGIYILAYFNAKASALVGIERDLNLSERVLRSLVTRVEHMTEEQMRAADGTQQLADEIALRKSGAQPAATAPESSEAEVESEV